MIALKSLMEKYRANDVKELMAYSVQNYSEMSNECVFYTMCLLSLFVSGDKKLLDSYNKFSEEFKQEFHKFIIDNGYDGIDKNENIEMLH